MKKYIKNILDKLSELYNIYQKYCWYHKENNITINIVIEDSNINYNLLDKFNNNIDEFTITFSNREEEIYTYMAIKIFLILLGNIPIYKEENIYYNNFYRPHTKIIINDERIEDIIDKIQLTEEKNTITDSHPTIKKLYKKIPLWNHNKARITTMGERIKLSKKLTEGLE